MCGCYGPASCNLQNELAACKEEGVCDCCASCNTCNQLFAGCANQQTTDDGYFEPLLPKTFNLGEAIGEYNISSLSVNYLGYPCVRPPLPLGLTINVTQDAKLFLTGTPNEIIPPTQYTLKMKAVAENIIAMKFTISIVQTNSANCPKTFVSSEATKNSFFSFV